MSVVVVRELSELVNYVSDWETLAASAIEPNIFYEPWFVLPAVEAFARGKQLQFVLVFATDPARRHCPKILCGFFPLERRERYRGLPVSSFSLWKYIHCYLGTPLLKVGYERECLETFFDWLATEAGDCALMEFGSIRGEGPFYELLVDHFHDTAKLTFTVDSYTRALFRPAATAQQYLQKSLPLKQRKQLKRRAAQLARQGQFEYLVLEADSALPAWIEGFLEVEASGWKGKEGSALACSETGRSFFKAIAKAAFQRHRLLMLALHLNDRPIAYRFSLLAEPGSFSFKVAFDEEYARFSPGVLLHLENIRYLHSHPEIHWMDSCTSPDNLLLNHLWPDRCAMLTVVVGTGRSSGDLAIAIMPLLRWLKRKLRRR